MRTHTEKRSSRQEVRNIPESGRTTGLDKAEAVLDTVEVVEPRFAAAVVAAAVAAVDRSTPDCPSAIECPECSSAAEDFASFADDSETFEEEPCADCLVVGLASCLDLSFSLAGGVVDWKNIDVRWRTRCENKQILLRTKVQLNVIGTNDRSDDVIVRD